MDESSQINAELGAALKRATSSLAEFRTDDELQVTTGRLCDYRSHALALAAVLAHLLDVISRAATPPVPDASGTPC